jgi:hypothetical protein
VKSEDFLLREYGALRDEIIKQTEIEFQLTAFTLIVASTLLSLSVYEPMSALLFRCCIL